MKKFLKIFIVLIVNIILVTFIIFMFASIFKMNKKTITNNYYGIEVKNDFFNVDYYEEEEGSLYSESFTNALPFTCDITAISKNNKWAFIDKNGNVLTEFKYTKVYLPTKNIFCVQKDDKYGFVNEKGEEITDFIYDKPSEFFDENYAYVIKDDKYGIINSKGELVIDCKYEQCFYSEQTFLFKIGEGKYEFTDLDGNSLYSFEADNVSMYNKGIAAIERSGKYGYIDKTGQTVIEFEYDKVGFLSDDTLVAYKKENDELLFLDEKGNVIRTLNAENIGYKEASVEDIIGYTTVGVIVKKDDLCGILNLDGEKIVDFEYDEIGSFSKDGYAKVKKDDKYGFIDENGNVVIEPKYDEASNLNDGIASVKYDDTWYLIDKNENLVVNYKYDYDYVSNYMNDIAIVMKDYKFGFLNKNGELIIGKLSNTIDIEDIKSFTDSMYTEIKKNGKWGITDVNGNILIECKYDYLSLNKDRIEATLNGKKGIIDINENTIIEFGKYDKIMSSNEELNLVKKIVGYDKEDEEEYKCGYIDLEGNEVIPLEYDDANDFNFSTGLAIVKKDNKYGFINKDGDTVIPFIYDYAKGFKDDLIVVSKNGKYGYIDKDGNNIIEFKYDNAELFYGTNIAIVAIGEKYGAIDRNGNIIIPFEYYNLDRKDEIILAQKTDDGNYGIFDLNGKLIRDFEYEDNKYYSEDMMPVKKDGKWGFINKSGKEVIKAQYDDIDQFSEGVCGVKLGDKWGFIDKNGNVVIDFKYVLVQPFSEDLAYVKESMEVSKYIDKNDNKIIDMNDYYLGFMFCNGRAEVSSFEQEYGIIDREGNLVIGDFSN